MKRSFLLLLLVLGCKRQTPTADWNDGNGQAVQTCVDANHVVVDPSYCTSPAASDNGFFWYYLMYQAMLGSHVGDGMRYAPASGFRPYSRSLAPSPAPVAHAAPLAPPKSTAALRSSPSFSPPKSSAPLRSTPSYSLPKSSAPMRSSPSFSKSSSPSFSSRSSSRLR